MLDLVDRNMLFKKYAYFSSTSPQLETHFSQYATEVVAQFPDQAKKLTVEIASNDGILLKYFKSLGSRILGIDPARNIARLANQQGIETLAIFFDEKIALRIAKKYGKAGVITANNVLAHTDNLHNIIEGVKNLLDTDGIFVFEAQYFGDLLAKNEFDNTYHEHVCYFSLAPLITLLSMHDLKICDVKHVDTQGGSLRVYASHNASKFSINPSIKKLLQKEKRQGLYSAKTYQKFSSTPITTKKNLVTLLKRLKKEGKTIAGYGAPAKGNTLLQYCAIGPNIIDYIVDNAPSKQQTHAPGSRIPIFAPSHLKNNTPDYVLLLAWNYADSILQREKWLKEKGVKFIKPIPDVKII